MDYYPPQPQPPKQTNHTLRNILLGGLGCLFLVGAIAVFVLVRFFGLTQGPARTIQHQLSAINAGKLHLAYSDFAVEYRRNHTLDEFQKDLETFSEQLPCRKSNFSHVNVTGGKADVQGTITGRDGSLFPVAYELIREKGEWKIIHYRWEPPGDQQTI